MMDTMIAIFIWQYNMHAPRFELVGRSFPADHPTSFASNVIAAFNTFDTGHPALAFPANS